jgi:hypothetical protein
MLWEKHQNVHKKISSHNRKSRVSQAILVGSVYVRRHLKIFLRSDPRLCPGGLQDRILLPLGMVTITWTVYQLEFWAWWTILLERQRLDKNVECFYELLPKRDCSFEPKSAKLCWLAKNRTMS